MIVCKIGRYRTIPCNSYIFNYWIFISILLFLLSVVVFVLAVSQYCCYLLPFTVNSNLLFTNVYDDILLMRLLYVALLSWK